MKKYLLVMLLSLALVSCGNNVKKEVTGDNTVTPSKKVEQNNADVVKTEEQTTEKQEKVKENTQTGKTEAELEDELMKDLESLLEGEGSTKVDEEQVNKVISE